MSTKTQSDWDAEYQDVVPPFDDSYAVAKHAVTDSMADLELDKVQVH